MRVLIALLLPLACLLAADPPDPAGLAPRDLLMRLVALRQPLNRAPDDQALLGRLQQTYVEFSLGGPADLRGSLGPWLAYAEEVSARRRELRKGAPPRDLADELPDLWLALAQGDARTAVAGLDRWPAAADEPAARALRLAATRDVRLADAHPPTTPLEWHGYLAACAAQQVPAPLTGDPEIPGVDKLAWRLVANRDPRISVSNVLADIPLLLNATTIPEETACRHLAALVTAYGRTPTPGATRTQLIDEADVGLQLSTFDRAEPFIAGFAACRELRGGPHGIRDANGLHLLVSVPDMAWYTQDRLYLAAVEQLAWPDPVGDRASKVGAAFEAAMPGSLIAARTYVGQWNGDPERGMALLAAIRRELDDPNGISPGVAVRGVPIGVQVAGKQAEPLVVHILRRLQSDGLPRPGVDVVDLLASIPTWTCRDELATAALAASRRDPYDQVLWEIGRLADPAYPLVELRDMTSTEVRTDAVIDVVEPTAFDDGSGLGVATIWNGALRIDAPGDYRFALDLEGTARLQLGDLHLRRTAVPGQAEGRIALAVGWVPLRLEWWKDAGHGRIRLLWATGDGAWEPVPAALLAQGADHRPGIEATRWNRIAWWRLTDGVRPADERRAADLPWLNGTRFYIGRGLRDRGRFADALAHLDAVHRAGWTDAELPWRYLDCLAWGGGTERAGDLLDALVTGGWNITDPGVATRVAVTLSRAGLQQEFTTRMTGGTWGRGCGRWIPSRMALGAGDFTGALEHLDAVVTEPDQHLHWRVEIESAILRRMVDGTEPDPALLGELAHDTRVAPSLRLVLAWYTGAITWEEALAKAPATADGDELLWYRGLHELTLGNHAAAREALAKLSDAHHDWFEAADADALLAWYAKQTPETLAALKTAKPLPPALERPRGF